MSAPTALIRYDSATRMATICGWHDAEAKRTATVQARSLGYEITHGICSECRAKYFPVIPNPPAEPPSIQELRDETDRAIEESRETIRNLRGARAAVLGVKVEELT